MKSTNENYTFLNVCRMIKKRQYTKGIDDIKLLIEVAACFFTGSAVAASAAVTTMGAGEAASIAAVVTAIAQKGKILDAAKRVIELLKNDIPSYNGKYERMHEAYTILWVASFFDAFENTIPDDILTEISLVAKEKEAILDSLPDMSENNDSDMEVKFPSLTYCIADVYKQLTSVYTFMTSKMHDFISDLSFYENASEKKIRTLDDKLKELPEVALATFKDQYLTLCETFEGFLIYLNLEKERENQIKVDTQYKDLINIFNCSHKDTVQGFHDIEKAILSINERQSEQRVKAITDHIMKKYKKAITYPIIKEEDMEGVNYPSIDEMFIPQHYKLLEYTADHMRLGAESVWMQCETREDMQLFWARFLLDPQSISHLVLILGDPGSGKSMLTQVISAKISSEAELVIRIPLRRYYKEIEDDEDDVIEEIICNQIKHDGDSKNRIETFKEIAGDNPKRPITLIFDGYDEVQQATGLAYPSFLKKIRNFQKHCKEENRPIRVVVTSRRTLIDKAIIPIGTLVMELLPFDKHQKSQWINIWNSHNAKLLNQAGLSEFRLPNNNKIDDLASQPLLLLMLAIYDADFDSQKNALQVVTEEKNESFNRTHLYNTLIRRFISRELKKGQRGKEKAFNDYRSDQSDQKEELIDAEMEKLGIAALGMFARERLWITVSEINKDFAKLKARTTDYKVEDNLETGEIFLGSFFFIHDSRNGEEAHLRDGKENNLQKKDASYVFLHKTFYEFLTADYILDTVFKRAIFLANLKKFDENYYKGELISFEKDFPQLYIALNSAAICAEPEITFMISEWGFQKAENLIKKESKISKHDMLITLGNIIDKHIECIRESTMLPSKDHTLIPGRPVTQRNALYILNLITVKALLEEKWETKRSNWQFLAQYIKLFASVFQSKNDPLHFYNISNMDRTESLILQFMSIFQIEYYQFPGNIVITKRKKIADQTSLGLLNMRNQVFRFLQDHMTEKIYMLHNPHVSNAEKLLGNPEPIIHDYNYQLLLAVSRLRSNLLYDQLPKIDEIKNFDECLSSSDTIDTSLVFSWVNYFHQLIQMHKTIDVRPKDIIIITERFIHICEQYNNSEWERILVLWLDTIHKIENLVYDNIILHVLAGTQISSLSGIVLYEMVKRMQDYLENPNKSVTLRFVDDTMYDARFLFDTGFHLGVGPQWAAGVLMLLRKLNIKGNEINTLIFSLRIERYSYDNQQVWETIPCVLKEYIKFGKMDIVRHYLNDLHLVARNIISPVFFEYAAIADTVHANDFFLHAFPVMKSIIEVKRDRGLSEKVLPSYLYLTCINMNDNDFDQIINYIVYSELGFDSLNRVFYQYPEIIIRFLVRLISDEHDTIMGIQMRTHLQGLILSNILFVFKYSFQLTLDCLCAIRKKNSTIVDHAIEKLLCYARLNGQVEEAEQLEKLSKI